jgi:hypothetical protein
MLLLAMIAVLGQADIWGPRAPAVSRPAPIPPTAIWDGRSSAEAVVIDPETGQMTFPMGRHPADALTRGCVFGLSHVRCPAPRDGDDLGRLADSVRDREEQNRIAFDVDLNQPRADPGARIDCTNDEEDARPGQRRCNFDEALHNSYVDAHEARTAPTAVDGRRTIAEAFDWSQDSADGQMAAAFDWGDEAALTAKPAAPATGRLGFATGQSNEKGQAPEPERQPERRSGCRQEEYRDADGSAGFRFVCGSGDPAALEALRQSLQPFPR